ncbi:MAG: hypothetical protein OEZ01_16785 [Candidatus Heimdallarchaeota archaeon]|nr:hypothetical protein [Candidatus Heimdallarchaeota archaeon]MDH5647670.1 hypothetical protein [Candidatus Heimdallarchaeota archaeon]
MEVEYEVKFHLYDGNEQNIKRHQSQYTKIRDEIKLEGSVMSKVLSYFFDALINLTHADVKFWENKLNESHNFYQEAVRMFTRFNNSRNVDARIDRLSDRLIHRAKGQQLVIEATKAQDIKIKLELFADALNFFNEEVNLSNQMQETMSSYAAFARASFCESQYLQFHSQSIRTDNSGEAKKGLMKARYSLRQATFIDPRYMSKLEVIEEELDDLTKDRILIKGEEYADIATSLSENGNYAEAIENFKKANYFYQRASTLASDTASRRFLLSSSTIYEASILEAEANQLFRRENETEKASIKFEDAGKLVAKGIALMGHFGSKSLEDTFTCQRDYYRAMSLQTKAITLFDMEDYDGAKQNFMESKKLFNVAVDTAKRCENEAIINLGKEADADINGYISMCDAMI